MHSVLDHFAYASADLDAAIDDFERRSGVRPSPGGSHPGQGTRNALVSLGPGRYLALDAPDPAQSRTGNNGAWMEAMAEPDLFLFAVATDDIAAAERAILDFGLPVRRREGSRRTSLGGMLAWEHLEVDAPGFGRAMPHVMQWRTTGHPSADAPAGCRLVQFEVGHPEPAAVQALYMAIGLDLPVRQLQSPKLRLTLSAAHGDFVL